MRFKTTKHCPRCEREKHLSAFAADASRPDGLNNRCRMCDRERHALRRRASKELVQPEPGIQPGSDGPMFVTRTFTVAEVSRILSLEDLLTFFKVDSTRWEVAH